MKVYNRSTPKANPTIRIQEKIIGILEETKNPIAISNLSKKAKTSYYQTRESINFLERLGIVVLIVSEGSNSILVQLKKGSDNYAEPRT